MAKTVVQEFTKGLWDEIPPFRLVLGLCPTLAVTKTVENGIGMGVAFTFVLLFSNILVSALRKIIPPKVRIACFIIIIATFVTIVDFLLAYVDYNLYQQLGIFIPLIVVNCIVLGRAEAFASKKGVVASFADAMGMGIGLPFHWLPWRRFVKFLVPEPLLSVHLWQKVWVLSVSVTSSTGKHPFWFLALHLNRFGS